MADFSFLMFVANFPRLISKFRLSFKITWPWLIFKPETFFYGCFLKVGISFFVFSRSSLQIFLAMA